MRYFHDAIGRQVLLHFNLPLQFQKWKNPFLAYFLHSLS
jgi:hypothetical protein